MPGVRITGEFGKLEAFRKALKTSPEILEVASRAGAEELRDKIVEGFRKEADPYGKPWAPKKVPDGRKVLSGKTSRLKGGWHIVQANKRGFTIAPSVDYAVFHQTGTSRMVARKMVPDASGLPNDWASALEEATQEAFLIHFGDLGGGGMGFITAKLAGLKRRFSVKAIMRKAVRAVTDDGS